MNDRNIVAIDLFGIHPLKGGRSALDSLDRHDVVRCDRRAGGLAAIAVLDISTRVQDLLDNTVEGKTRLVAQHPGRLGNVIVHRVISRTSEVVT